MAVDLRPEQAGIPHTFFHQVYGQFFLYLPLQYLEVRFACYAFAVCIAVLCYTLAAYSAVLDLDPGQFSDDLPVLERVAGSKAELPTSLTELLQLFYRLLQVTGNGMQPF